MNLRHFVETRRESILHLWRQKLAERPAAAGSAVSHDAMIGVLDSLLDALARSTASPSVVAAPLRRPQASDPGISVEDAVHDYGALCDAMMQVGADEGLTFAAGDFRIFNVLLDEAIARGLSAAFDEAHLRDERAASERREVLAHELRNALSSATYAFEAIEHGRVGLQGQTAEVLKRSHARMQALIEHEFLKARGRGQAPLQLEPMNLSELLHHLVSAAVLQRGVRISLEQKTDRPIEVDGDEAMLSSALGNLLSNALKFTHDGGLVTVRATATRDCATIEVEDECGGLPGPVETLFEPYVQRSGDRSGSGLGLTVARDVALAHKGALTARDLPGKGCVFVLKLPRSGG